MRRALIGMGGLAVAALLPYACATAVGDDVEAVASTSASSTGGGEGGVTASTTATGGTGGTGGIGGAGGEGGEGGVGGAGGEGGEVVCHGFGEGGGAGSGGGVEPSYDCDLPGPLGELVPGAYARLAGDTAAGSSAFDACGGPGPEHVYGFELKADTSVRVRLTGFDLAAAIYGGSCLGGAQLACQDESSGSTELFRQELPVGQFWLVVDGAESGSYLGSISRAATYPQPTSKTTFGILNAGGGAQYDQAGAFLQHTFAIRSPNVRGLELTVPIDRQGCTPELTVLINDVPAGIYQLSNGTGVASETRTYGVEQPIPGEGPCFDEFTVRMESEAACLSGGWNWLPGGTAYFF